MFSLHHTATCRDTSSFPIANKESEWTCSRKTSAVLHVADVGDQICNCWLQGLPSGGPAFLTTVAFHGGIAAILVLYFIFWVRLTLIDTLLPLLLLSIFTFYFGFLALRRSAKVGTGLKQE